MIDSIKITGGHGNRKPLDFYPTPPDVTIALIRFLESSGLLFKEDNAFIWECACGEHGISSVFSQKGYSVFETDIITGSDFLKTDMPDKTKWIITNPPFLMAEEFIKRAKSFDVPFAFLLKSQYWHSRRRYDLFNQIRPNYVLPLTWRPDFTGGGASLLDMCWNIWLPMYDIAMTRYIPLARPAKNI